MKRGGSKEEVETMLRLEARSHANECEELARAERQEYPHGSPVADALERAATFIRRLTGGSDVV